MAFKKTLVQRLFNLSRFSTPTVARNAAAKPSSEPPETSKIKKSTQRRPFYQSATAAAAANSLRLFPPTGENNIAEKLKSMNIAKDRIQLSGLMPLPFPHAPSHAPPEAREEMETGLTISEVRKVLRASQTELIRVKLTEVEKDWVSYKEFIEIIEKSCGGNKEQALTFAKTLDDCGSVIVLGNSVCLRPHQEIKTLVRQI